MGYLPYQLVQDFFHQSISSNKADILDWRIRAWGAKSPFRTSDLVVSRTFMCKHVKTSTDNERCGDNTWCCIPCRNAPAVVRRWRPISCAKCLNVWAKNHEMQCLKMMWRQKMKPCCRWPNSRNKGIQLPGYKHRGFRACAECCKTKVPPQKPSFSNASQWWLSILVGLDWKIFSHRLERLEMSQKHVSGDFK